MPNTYGAIDANGNPIDAYVPPPAADGGFIGWLNNALSGASNPENRAKVQALLTDPNGTTFDQKIAQEKLAQDQAAVAANQHAPYAYGGGGGPLSGAITPDAVRGAINTKALASQGGGFSPISAANATPVQQAQGPVQPASLVPVDSFRLPGVEAYGGLANSDAGSITRAASPTATYGFQDQSAPPPANQTNITDHAVGHAFDAVQSSPGDSWYQKISHALANLPNDPIFNVGMALLGARRGQPIGESVIKGFAQAAAFKDNAQAQQQQQLATQQAAAQQAAIRGFDPSQYRTGKDAYAALLHSGLDPKDAASIVGTAFPASEYQGFAAGSTVIDKSTGKVVAQVPAVPTGGAASLQQGIALRDSFPIGSPQWTTYDNYVKTLAPANGVAAKPPTEFQSKSADYGNRAKAANVQITNAENSDSYSTYGQATRHGIDKLTGTSGALTNWMATPEAQKVQAAQDEWINAVARRESGATINPSEYEAYRQTYFAQPGDSKQVIAQKQAARDRVYQGMVNSGPTGGSGSSGGTSQAPARLPTPQEAAAEYQRRNAGKQ